MRIKTVKSARISCLKILPSRAKCVGIMKVLTLSKDYQPLQGFTDQDGFFRDWACHRLIPQGCFPLLTTAIRKTRNELPKLNWFRMAAETALSYSNHLVRQNENFSDPSELG